MLYQGNGNESVDGVYERERLRRRARKLGLRLVKPRVQRSEAADHSVAPVPTRGPLHKPIREGSCGRNSTNAADRAADAKASKSG